MRSALALALVVALACGPTPEARDAARPVGTLVVVIRQGPDRVPFQPKVDRIRRANEQLAAILGHSIQIELDGSLMPQDHDGAEDVIARLLETVAQDLDALKKEDPKALLFARDNFEQLVVRYAPTEAAARAPEHQTWGRHHTNAKLDLASKTIDVVLPEARWLALEHGDIGAPLFRAFDAGQDARFAKVMPEMLPASEQAAWIAYHAHQSHSDLGAVDTLRVRGLLSIANVPEARKQLIEHELGHFSETYHHNAAEVERARPDSAYKQTEASLIGWLGRELPRMTPEERTKVAQALWVFDFRKQSGDKDRFATYSWPGLDPMAFALETFDAWVATGHPTKPDVWDIVVGPTRIEMRDGELHFQQDGRGDRVFYRWAVATKAREDALGKAMTQWTDAGALTSAFFNTRRAFREEGDYLRFLRRFEENATTWKIGADVLRSEVFRPSAELLAESRRQWREVPVAQGHVLFYFARHADGSYHPVQDWDDMLQDKKADDAALAATLDLGWPSFSLLPVMWPALTKSSARIRIIDEHAQKLLAENIRAAPGHKDVAGTLAAVASLLCGERSMGELAALRSFAERELADRPGAGLSSVVLASDPAKCQPKGPAPRPPPIKKPRWKEGDPLPPKAPF